MTIRNPIENGLGWLYEQATGDEDARVCKDIPEEACDEQPRNFFAYLLANVLSKISDELVSARITLPWLFNVLGVPAGFTGFLVPVREACVLLPQLFVAAYIRTMPQRKYVWITGAICSAAMLLLMAFVTSILNGVEAGWLLLLCLIVYSLARGLCSVAAKDVLGKTISKTRRGRLMGYSAFLAGISTLIIGLLIQADIFEYSDVNLLLGFILVAALLWLFAVFSFRLIIESDGATEGGGNSITEALLNLRLIFDDPAFSKYLLSRLLLTSVALVIPFYVILVQQHAQGELSQLGMLIIINGLASSLSAPLIGKFADQNSRAVMASAAALAGIAGMIVLLWNRFFSNIDNSEYVIFIIFFLVTLAHGAARLGRKVYLVDMANSENRAKYVAVSNSVIGIAMLAAGSVGILADLYSIETVIFILSAISLFGSYYISQIRNVSG